MNDKDIKKTINDIVWWIPNRKLRDKVRDFFESKAESRCSKMHRL